MELDYYGNEKYTMSSKVKQGKGAVVLSDVLSSGKSPIRNSTQRSTVLRFVMSLSSCRNYGTNLK